MSCYGFMPGDVCYKFRLDTLISNPNTSQSDVWLATDQATETRVALKLIEAGSDPNNSLILLYEAKVGAKLKHANLCEVIGADIFEIERSSLAGSSKRRFVAIGFQYQPRGTCANIIKGPGMMPVYDLHRLLLNVLCGLEYLHELGWRHNDIKPANILIGPHGEYMLTDYGISWTPSQGNPTAGCYVPYITPESILTDGTNYDMKHTPTVQSDLYQLGVTAFRLLNGVGLIRDDFNKYQQALNPMEFLRRVKIGELPSRTGYDPSVPYNIRHIINKALSPDPLNRYISALEMRRALEKLSFPHQWICDPTGIMHCTKKGADYQIEESSQGGTFNVCLIKRNVNSGKVIRPSKDIKKSLTRSQANSHRQKIMQEVMKP